MDELQSKKHTTNKSKEAVSKLFLHMMVPLDGYIEGPTANSTGVWQTKSTKEHVNQMLRSIDGIIIGRNVYEIFINY